MKNTILIGVVVALLAVVGLVFLKPPAPASVDVGAIPGTDVDGNYFSIGGIEYYHAKFPLIASSSVPCYIPSNRFGVATSSLVWASLSATANGMGVATFDFSTTTSNGGYATTSPSLAYGVPLAVSPRPFVWNTASTTGARTIGMNVNGNYSDVFILPGEALTFRIATGTPQTYASYLTGHCEVVLRKL